MPVKEQNSVNLAALSVNDVYVLIAPPASTSIQGVDTGICGLVGTAAWGPLNTPVLLGTPAEVAAAFGPIQDMPNDLTTDVLVLMQLGVSTVYGVRVGDGSEAKATHDLQSADIAVLAVAGVLQAGDELTYDINGVSGTYTVTADDVALGGSAGVTEVARKIALMIRETPALTAVCSVASDGGNINLVATNADGMSVTASVGGTTPTTEFEAPASGTFEGGGDSIGVFTALYTGTEGNNIEISFEEGDNSTAAERTWNLLVARRGVAPLPEKFTNLPESTLATAIESAVLNGQGPARGPSQLVRFAPTAASAVPPTHTVALAMTGGADGAESLTNGQQLGSPAAVPATGLYALENTGVQQIGLCGNTDSTLWPSVLAAAKQFGALSFGCYPASTTTQAAIATKKDVGIDDAYMALVKDWVQFFDSYNNKFRLVSPLPFAMGRTASLNPNESPGNKPIGLIVATEKTLADQKYSPAELALLHKNGITVITNQCPGGSFFGLRHGLNSSSNNAINGIEWTRMTNFLAYSFNAGFGEYIEKLQTIRPNDPLRESARKKLRNFLIGLRDAENPLIDDFAVDMSFGAGKVNTVQSVEQGFMKAVVRVRYMSVVRFFVITLIGGKTVEVSVQ